MVLFASWCYSLLMYFPILKYLEDLFVLAVTCLYVISVSFVCRFNGFAGFVTLTLLCRLYVTTLS